MEHDVSKMNQLYQLVVTIGFFAFAVLSHILKEVIFTHNGQIDKKEFLFYLILFCFLFVVVVEVLR